METIKFDEAFKALTGNDPFPWQRELYEKWFALGKVPQSCNLPTGLGKTSVIAVWLIALANKCNVPRRLVYVVNRRTVVDQTTDEVEKYRRNLAVAGIPDELAISTLRGQFADNREWSADPSRPAVICGTVDMIGSRLLFSGYGCGFKTRPLHAGFLGQDSLLVHDEAHLEPAFQKLLLDIEAEQKRCKDFRPMKVTELTATSRADGEAFGLSESDYKNDVVKQRINAKKAIYLIPNKDEKKLAEEVAELALKYKDADSAPAVLVFVRKVDDVDKITKKLPKDSFEQLTGTLRGLERDGLVKKPIFQRFLSETNRDKDVEPKPGTVYLVCTSAGEVGVNISADHLVCDLSTFESMAQRFGRVNRFGDRKDTDIHIVHPKEFEDKPPEPQMKKTLGVLESLNGDGSPAALGRLDPLTRQAAFAPPPTILPTSDILFDAWALTTIRDKLPGRPHVEPYLHGISGWEPPETHVAWRQEVWELRLQFKSDEEGKQNEASERKRLGKFAEDLLEDYPLKPHELLRDRSDRVFKHLVAIAERHPHVYVWLVDDEGSVEVFTLKELADKEEKERINGRTLLLPPEAGGLRDGLLDGGSTTTTGLDVADEWYADEAKTIHRRVRLWDVDSPPIGMRRIRKIDTKPDADEAVEEPAAKRFWYWYESAKSGDGDGSKNTTGAVTWDIHTKDVVCNTMAIVEKLLDGELRRAFTLAARCHDLGKKRKLFQTVLGNRDYPRIELAKSGKKGGRIEEKYRHEFGSLIDTEKHKDFDSLGDLKEFVLHIIATHHGRGRPHFPAEEAFDPERSEAAAAKVARETPQRFARLQRKYGRWGLAYLESLLRAADYAASAKPSAFYEEDKS
jgi:CRISPR-associated endonuclease/helicase Cas3